MSPLPLADLLNWAEPEPALFKGQFIPRGHLSVLAGESRLGKSTLTLEWALGLLRGRAFGGVDPEPTGTSQSVLILSGEDHPYTITERIFAICEAYDADKAAVETVIKDERLAVMAECSQLFEHSQHPPKWTQLGQDLWAHVDKLKPDLIIIDPLSVYGGLSHENDSGQVNGMALMLKQLARLGNSGLLLVHHVGKPSEDVKSNWQGSQHRIRGSSALASAARSVAIMEAARDGGIEVFVQGNYGPSSSFRLYRDDRGILLPVQAQDGERVARAICGVMRDRPELGGLTRRDIVKLEKASAKELKSEVSKLCGNVTASDLLRGIEAGIKNGLLRTETRLVSGKNRETIYATPSSSQAVVGPEMKRGPGYREVSRTPTPPRR